MDLDVKHRLLDACENGLEAEVCEILDSGNVSVADFEGEDSNSLLNYAAANGHDSVVAALLERGGVVDAGSMYQWSPLMQACAYGHMSVVTCLLKSSADVNRVNVLGASALVCAARGGHTSVVHTLIAANARVDPLAESEGSLTPLMAAAMAGHESVCRLLVDGGANVNARQAGTGWTALMHAAANGYLSVAQALVAANCDVDLVNVLDMSAADIAADTSHDKVSKYLLKKTGRTKAAEKTLDIFEATKQNEYDVVRSLLDNDPSLVNLEDEHEATPLMFAAMRGHLAVAELLVDRGAELDCQDAISQWTALMNATYYGHRSVVRLLVQSGANIVLTAQNGCTAYDIASLIGDTEIVHLLAAASISRPQSTRSTQSQRSARPPPKVIGKGLPPAKSRNVTIRSDRSFASLMRSQNRMFSPIPERVTPQSGDEADKGKKKGKKKGNVKGKSKSSDKTKGKGEPTVRQKGEGLLRSGGKAEGKRSQSFGKGAPTPRHVAAVAPGVDESSNTPLKRDSIPTAASTHSKGPSKIGVDGSGAQQPARRSAFLSWFSGPCCVPRGRQKHKIAPASSPSSLASRKDSGVVIRAADPPQPPWRADSAASRLSTAQSDPESLDFTVDLPTYSIISEMEKEPATRLPVDPRFKNLNMGGPMNKLSAEILAPIRPPFMPPPAFELVHIERPKFERPQRNSSDFSNIPAILKGPQLSRMRSSFLRPQDKHVGLPRKPLPRPESSEGGRSTRVRFAATPGSRMPSVGESHDASPPLVQPQDVSLDPSSAEVAPTDHTAFISSLLNQAPAAASLGGPSDPVLSDSMPSDPMPSDPLSEESDTAMGQLPSVLQSRQLGHLVPVFQREEIDTDCFLTLTDNDMMELGIEKSDTRNILMRIIADIKRGDAPLAPRLRSQPVVPSPLRPRSHSAGRETLQPPPQPLGPSLSFNSRDRQRLPPAPPTALPDMRRDRRSSLTM
mmetsp:Transcript_23305/g.60992  ORF Transcript_23305/g.60992 Transcript_23305/m.60992 type:complete len:963 (+) Transcript_23305:153-3041(+)